MTTAILKKEIKTIAKASVQEALAEELMRWRSKQLPPVSAREQKDIEKRYGKPSGKGVRTIRVRI